MHALSAGSAGRGRCPEQEVLERRPISSAAALPDDAHRDLDEAPRNTVATTRRGVAPIAMRMPISRVRAVTACVTTP